MMLTIADFLSITEVDEGKLQLHQTTFQLDKLMRDCINDLETNWHSIEQRCDPTVHILADWPKMDQVFANLLNNAIKLLSPWWDDHYWHADNRRKSTYICSG
ncbi:MULTISPECIES: hypothetical protein [Sphingobacterium]|uniref:hypothetical protein n=1 Tax=Sphingobacterium TaxID=28453 RepID=UPI00257B1798|nr:MULTISPECIES: hypothetical protein [Sphingobacterium]